MTSRLTPEWCEDVKKDANNLIQIAKHLFSKQVEATSYYFLKLTPDKGDELVVVCGGRERCRPDYLIQREGFRYYSFEFVVEGRGELSLGGKTFALGPGVAFGYGPGRGHRIWTDPKDPMVKYFVDFAGRRARSFFQGSPCAHAPVQVSDPIRIRDVYDELEHSARGGSAKSVPICNVLLQLLALRLAELGVARTTVHGRAIESYHRCRDLIDARAMALDSLQEIARACHMDPAYLCRLFRRFGNTTPYHYLQRRRMNRAAALLQDTNLMIKQVADQLGFADAFHFSRSFKRVHGMSPSRFAALSHRH
jgi:AraC-like DNA-binding protein